MLAKLCPCCKTPLAQEALSCPNCGHMWIDSPEEEAGASPPKHRRYLIVGLLTLLAILIAGFLFSYSQCFFCPKAQQNAHQFALSQAVGNQEKRFFAERFASTEGVTLYRDIIDHELTQAEDRGYSTLLGDQLPDNLEKVSARQLTEDYARNEFNADTRYHNHTLLIDAHIDAIQYNAGSSPCLFIRGKDALHDIQACLRNASYVVHDSVLLRPRSSQRFICRGEGYVITSSMLGDCVPLVSIFRQRAQELKHSCITHVTRGQLFIRLRDTSHPLYHTKPLLLLLRAEYGVSKLPECQHGWSTFCEHALQKTRDDDINRWLHSVFQEHGILYGVSSEHSPLA